MSYEIYDDELDLLRATGVLVEHRPPRWWTITKWTVITAAALALTLWIGHQADQHLAAALDAGWGA